MSLSTILLILAGLFLLATFSLFFKILLFPTKLVFGIIKAVIKGVYKSVKTIFEDAAKSNTPAK
ncbi:MAG TPA: hypothetical protein VM577_21370 [Anaerovoracaceae bacterium]|nr:hypothetical protein [Anaerovoracaceae bacterium]